MSILGFFKRRDTWQDHPLVDPGGKVFVFVFRDKHRLLEELEFTCLLESVMLDRDALVRRKGSVLSMTKRACQSARLHNGNVLANWVRSGMLSAGEAFRDHSFLGRLRTGDFRDEKSAIQTLGFVPYVLALGPISERYAAVLARKLAEKFPKYLGLMFFSAQTAMKTVADSLRSGGMFELEL